MVGWLTRIPIEGWSVGQRPFFDYDRFWSCLVLSHSAHATQPVSLLEDLFHLTEGIDCFLLTESCSLYAC
jgi:hypothetical protein